jgi:endonuclease YncB( thermonuclease family)
MSQSARLCLSASVLALALAPVPAAPQAPAAQAPAASPAPSPRPTPKPQQRPHGQRVTVDPRLVEVDDGDTVVIRWSDSDAEIVRILGIDTPETRHLAHNLPFAQSFGEEARAFAQGAFAATTQIELLRASTVDPFDRSLGYFFLNGRNYSVQVVSARLAAESITPFGDNGFPKEAAEVLAASQAAGPLPFEPPHQYRARMRDVTRWMKEKGLYPEQ